MMDRVLVMWVLHREEADVEQAKLSRLEINVILVQIQMQNIRKHQWWNFYIQSELMTSQSIWDDGILVLKRLRL